jgi:hypothetical protein
MKTVALAAALAEIRLAVVKLLFEAYPSMGLVMSSKDKQKRGAN